MRKYLSLLLILMLPALLAACYPVAGVNTLPQPAATGLATTQPALTTGATAAAANMAEETPVQNEGAGSTAAPTFSPITGTLLLSGTTSALEGATPMSQPTSSAPGGPPAPVTAAIAGAARQLGVRPDALTLLSYEAVDWPDACLGVITPGIMCAQVVTPGYRILLRGPQGELEVHTAAAGTPARILKPGTEGGFSSTAAAPTAQSVVPASTAAPANGSGGSGIEGLVTIGPVTPTSREGQVNARPYQATIDVLDQSGQVVTRFLTNAQGLFRVALAPGAYVIRPESAGRFPRAAQQTVRVSSGTFVKVDIQYDSGIR